MIGPCSNSPRTLFQHLLSSVLCMRAQPPMPCDQLMRPHHGSGHTEKGHLLYTCAFDIIKCLPDSASSHLTLQCSFYASSPPPSLPHLFCEGDSTTSQRVEINAAPLQRTGRNQHHPKGGRRNQHHPKGGGSLVVCLWFCVVVLLGLSWLHGLFVVPHFGSGIGCIVVVRGLAFAVSVACVLVSGVGGAFGSSWGLTVLQGHCDREVQTLRLWEERSTSTQKTEEGQAAPASSTPLPHPPLFLPQERRGGHNKTQRERRKAAAPRRGESNRDIEK